MKQNKTRAITQVALIAALYITLILLFPAVGFGPIQFRPAELLNFLIIVHPLFAIGVTIGVFISNLFLGYGVGLDLLFGTFHTALSFMVCYIIFKKVINEKMKYVIVTCVFSFLMIIIAFELCLIENDFSLLWEMYGTLFMSELLVLGIGSFIMLPINNLLMKQGKRFKK